jgi:hypothetical protein
VGYDSGIVGPDQAGGYSTDDVVVHRVHRAGEAFDRYRLLSSGAVLIGQGDAEPTSILTDTNSADTANASSASSQVIVDFDGDSAELITLTGSPVSVIFANIPPAGERRTITKYFLQDATGGRVVTHGTDVVSWASGWPLVMDLRPGVITGVTYDGIGGYVVGHAPQFDPDAVVSGETTIDRMQITSGAIGWSSGALMLSYFTARKTESIATLGFLCGSSAASSPTLIRAAVYSVSNPATGALAAQLAATASDTALFAVANERYTKALSTAWAKVAGTRYAIGVLQVSAGSFNLSGKLGGASATVGSAAIYALSPVVAKRVTGLTDLPADPTAVTLASYGGRIYAEAIP